MAQWFKDAVIATIEGIEYSLEQDLQRVEQLRPLENWNDMLLRLKIKSDLIKAYGVAKDEDEKENNRVNQDLNNDDSDIYAEPGGFLPSKGEQTNSDNFTSNSPSMGNEQPVEEDDEANMTSGKDEGTDYDEYEAFMEELEE